MPRRRTTKTQDANALTVIDSTPSVDSVAARKVFDWIVAGHCEHDIVEAIATQFAGSDAKPLIAAAMAQLTNAGKADPDLIRGWSLESARELYRRAMEANDAANALAALKFIAKLGGA
jgi:hypothetical protein